MRRISRLHLAWFIGVLVLLLLLVMVAPGWGMPDQSVVRQTVPELDPRAYLPLIMRNVAGP